MPSAPVVEGRSSAAMLTDDRDESRDDKRYLLFTQRQVRFGHGDVRSSSPSLPGGDTDGTVCQLTERTGRVDDGAKSRTRALGNGTVTLLTPPRNGTPLRGVVACTPLTSGDGISPSAVNAHTALTSARTATSSSQGSGLGSARTFVVGTSHFGASRPTSATTFTLRSDTANQSEDDSPHTDSVKLKEAEVEAMEARRMCVKLGEQMNELRRQLAAMEEDNAALRAVTAASRAREELATKTAEALTLSSATALSSQVERLVAANQQLRAELARERKHHEEKINSQRAHHERFLLSVAGDFSELQEAHATALARITALEGERTGFWMEQRARMAQVQATNTLMLDRTYLSKAPSVMRVSADREMYGNTLHDKLLEEDSEERNAAENMQKHSPRASTRRIPTAPSSAQPSHFSSTTADTSSRSCRPFSRLCTRLSRVDSSAMKAVSTSFPRHTMEELLARHSKEARRSPR